MMLPLQRSLFQLTVMWFAALAVGVVLIFTSSATGWFGTSYGEAWKWLLPNILPTMGALFAAVVVSQRRAKPGKRVPRALFALGVSVSGLYLLVLLGTLLAAYVRLPTGVSPVDWLLGSNVYLGPLQGLVAGLLAIFHVRRS